MQNSHVTSTATMNGLRKWAGYDLISQVMELCGDVKFYLAGGAVRESIRRVSGEPKDFDFFIQGQRLERVFDFLAAYGELTVGPFGSPRWLPHIGEDRYADVIVIANFYNGLWRCENLVDALNQFDFTANAIGVDLRTAAVFDPQNGMRDLCAGVMRAVRFDYPDEPISANCSLSRLSILWIRIVHYARILGLRIEPVTLRWLREQADRARDVPEFTRTFFAPNIADFSP